MDITNPGVQKPHCEPCALANRCCTACNDCCWPSLLRTLPIPSAVITEHISTKYNGITHALQAVYLQRSMCFSLTDYSCWIDPSTSAHYFKKKPFDSSLLERKMQVLGNFQISPFKELKWRYKGFDFSWQTLKLYSLGSLLRFAPYFHTVDQMYKRHKPLLRYPNFTPVISHCNNENTV